MFKMLRLLQNGKIYKKSELAAELGVSEKMIQNYRNDLEMAGFIIDFKSGPYGGYYVGENFFLKPFNFTDQEKDVLVGSLEKMNSNLGDQSEGAFQCAIEKIKSSLTLSENDERYIYHINKAQLNPDLKEEERFNIVYHAIKNRTAVEIVYQNVTSLEVKKRRIDPYGLIFFDGAYYTVAFCHLKQAQRTFKLVRIESFKTLDSEHYEIPQDFKLKMQAETNEFGLIKEKVRVKLKISKGLAKTFAEFCWSPDQTIKKEVDGSLIFTGTVLGDKTLRKWILGMGSNVEILEPDSLRNEILNEVEEMLMNLNK